MSPDIPDVQYIRRTCLLQAAATMFTSSQYHCGEQCKLLDDIFQGIERETGWNSNHAVAILNKLWEHYKANVDLDPLNLRDVQQPHD
jgi:hypothetical protein